MITAPPRIRFSDPQIEMAHGAGGKASRRLVEGLIAPALLGSQATARRMRHTSSVDAGQIAFTADSFVVRPLRFNGGSIGELAVNGTVNDLAVSGARAETLVATFVLEAGLPTSVLEGEVSRHGRRGASRGSVDRRRRHQGRGTRPSGRDVHHDRRHRPRHA